MSWAFILFGGIMEIFWVSGLKYSTSFWEYFWTALGIILSFASMILATKRIEVSIAYAIFVGIGTSGVVLAEIFVFGAPTSFLQLLLIGILLVSIIGLKLVSKDSNTNDTKAIAEVSKRIGIDEIENQIESQRQ